MHQRGAEAKRKQNQVKKWVLSIAISASCMCDVQLCDHVAYIICPLIVWLKCWFEMLSLQCVVWTPHPHHPRRKRLCCVHHPHPSVCLCSLHDETDGCGCCSWGGTSSKLTANFPSQMGQENKASSFQSSHQTQCGQVHILGSNLMH